MRRQIDKVDTINSDKTIESLKKVELKNIY